MTIPLFTDAEERQMAVTAIAAMALPGLLSRWETGAQPTENVVNNAFEIAETFITEAERRHRSPP